MSGYEGMNAFEFRNVLNALSSDIQKIIEKHNLNLEKIDDKFHTLQEKIKADTESLDDRTSMLTSEIKALQEKIFELVKRDYIALAESELKPYIESAWRTGNTHPNSKEIDEAQLKLKSLYSQKRYADGPEKTNLADKRAQIKTDYAEKKNLEERHFKKEMSTLVDEIKKEYCERQKLCVKPYTHQSVPNDANFFKWLAIPVKLNPVFATLSNRDEYVMTVSAYIEKMKALFEFWLDDEDALIFEPFIQFLSMYFNKGGRDCIYGSCMTKWLGIDSGGNLYPCGRSYPLKYRLGNISDIHELSSVFLSDPYINILKSSIIRRNTCKETCNLFGYCNGGCNNTFILEGDIEKAGGFTCDSFIALFSFVKARLDNCLTNNESFKNPFLIKFLGTKTVI